MRAYYLNMAVGASSVSSPFIVSTTIINVKREGTGQNEVASSPGSRDFVYNVVTGSISFLNAAVVVESVFVLCL